MEFFERNQRDISIRSWGDGISPRTDSRKRREAVPFDGFIGVDGIPVGPEGRGQAPQWEWEGREAIASSRNQKRLALMARLRVISASYLGIMLIAGAILQGVIH